MVQKKRSLLWEILVPTHFSDGKMIPVIFHKKWDEKVRSITGGLTILKPAKGQWISPDGILFVEKMIPVRLICTRPEIVKIINLTLDYYHQRAVLAYALSSEVILRNSFSSR
ncbi:TPA: hypothetical protein HA241_04245 [Candidatus Woesearchaeota archaeon]|nr:hypothetical protein [Candidatus Woesearchaeota archaeon]